MKLKGLPFQTVQFQFCASAMRLDAEAQFEELTKQERISLVKSRELMLIDMAKKNAAFWIAQLHICWQADPVFIR